MSQFPEKEVFTGDSPMPFGQYQGQKISAIPASYLLFLYRQERSGRITDYIKTNMETLLKKANKEPKSKKRKR